MIVVFNVAALSTAKYPKMALVRSMTRMLDEIKAWCEENCKDHYLDLGWLSFSYSSEEKEGNMYRRHFEFHNETDAIYFKLRWFVT